MSAENSLGIPGSFTDSFPGFDADAARSRQVDETFSAIPLRPTLTPANYDVIIGRAMTEGDIETLEYYRYPQNDDCR